MLLKDRMVNSNLASVEELKVHLLEGFSTVVSLKF